MEATMEVIMGVIMEVTMVDTTIIMLKTGNWFLTGGSLIKTMELKVRIMQGDSPNRCLFLILFILNDADVEFQANVLVIIFVVLYLSIF